MSTVYERAGAAHSAGLMPGAAFGVAQTRFGGRTLLPREAKSVGRVLSGNGLPAPADVNFVEVRNHAEKVRGAQSGVGDPISNAFGGAVEGAASGVSAGLDWLHSNVWEPSLDYVEAASRYTADRSRRASDESGFMGRLGALRFPGTELMDPEFRDHYWNPARRASEEGYGPSVAQMAWEYTAQANVQGLNAEGRRDLPLIDDPALFNERQNYFNHGVQKWVTGVSDAVLSVVVDPTVLVSAGAGKVAQGARAVKAADVAAASASGRGVQAAAKVAGRDADNVVAPVDSGKGVTEPGQTPMSPSDDITGMSPSGDMGVAPIDDLLPGEAPDFVEDTFRKNRVQRNIEKLTDFMDDRFSAVREGVDGGGLRADIMNDPVVKRMGPNAGMMVDAAAWVSSTFTDDLIRKGVMDDVWLAGMGDRLAMDRLGQVNQRMALDLEAMVSPDGKAVREAIDASPYLSTAEKWNASNSDDLWTRQKAIIEEDVAEFEKGLTDRLAQVRAEGRAGLDSVGSEAGAVTHLTEIPLTTGLQRRIQTAKTLTPFQSLPGVQVLSGVHVPSTLSLTDDRAVEIFDKHVRTSLLTLGKDRYKVHGGTIRDAFATSTSEIAPGTSRAQRSDVVRKFNNTMTENLAAKLAKQKGWDKGEVKEWITAARRQWADDVESAVTHMRQAAESGQRVVITGDGTPFAMGRDLSKAVSQGQYAQVEALVDWKRMDRQLRKHFMPGAIQKPVPGAGEILRDGTNFVLNEFTDLWKFAALLRPVAYPARVQMDTQLRNLATMGVMETGLMALRGTKNLMSNLGRVDVGVARLHERKMLAAQEAWAAEDLVAPFLRPDGSLASDAPKNVVAAKARWDEADRISGMDIDEFFDLAMRGDDVAVEVKALRAERGQLKRLATVKAGDTLTTVGDPERLAAVEARLQELTREGANINRVTGGLTAEQLLGRARRRSTSMKQVQGSSQRVDAKTGEWITRPDQTDAYVFGDSDLRGALLERGIRSTANLLSNSAGGQPLLNQLGKSSDMLAGALRENRLSRGFVPIEYGVGAAANNRWRNSLVDQVNKHVRNDASLMKMALGVGDDDIVTWMRTAPEGKEYWASHKLKKDGEAKWANEWELVSAQRAHFDMIVPSRRAADTIAARDVTPNDVDSWWGEGDLRPQIPSELSIAIDMSSRERALAGYDALRAKYFNLASTLPETYMGRHPQYQRLFRSHMDRLMSATNKGRYSQADIRALRKRADNAARKDMGRIMFDTSHRSELSHKMRFLAPFYSAWSDVMVKWSRIIAQRPEVAPLLLKGFDSTAAAFVVVDDDGNRIMANGDVWSLDEEGNLLEKVGVEHNPSAGSIVLPFGGWVQDKTGANDMLLSRASLNSVFQGEVPFLPGLGPLATVPVNEFMSGNVPGSGTVGPLLADNLKVDIPGVGTADLMTYLQPFGQTDRAALEQLMPGWMGNLQEIIVGDSRRSQQVKAQLMANQVNAENLGLTPRLSEEDRMEKVSNQARNWWWLRFVGSQVPVSTRPNTRLDYYYSKFHEYREQYGLEAEEQFLADYPEYGEVTVSASMNETGIQATESAHKAMQPWRKQIAAHPEIGWALVGPEANQGEFSDAVYTNQIREEIYSPVSDKTSRRARTDDEIRTDVVLQNGWREWMQMSRALDVRAEELGLSSLQAAGAGELRQIKDEFKADLMERNPEWARAYNEGGSTGANPVAPFLDGMVSALAGNPKAVEGRDDLRALSEYVEMRDAVRSRMLEAGFKSTSAEFQETELYLVWSDFVADLKRQSPVFEDMFLRAGLERDNLASDPLASVRGGN